MMRATGLIRTLAALALSSFSIPAGAQTLSGFTEKSPEELTQEGRLIVGRGIDYEPTTENEISLAARLKNSMQERRTFAWHIVEQMLLPTKVKLPEGDVTVDVPRWQTWYEGMGSQELRGVLDIFFRKLKANPGADRALLADETLDDQADRTLVSSLTDERFTAILEQFKNVPGLPAELGGRGFTLFSPSFVLHVLSNSEAIEKCQQNIAADQPPPSNTNFSNCIPEFPRSSVMVKSVWVPLDQGVKQHKTDASAMTEVITNGTWPSDTPVKHPTREEIYTNVTKEDTAYGLTAIHFSTKDVREWVWVTLWWDPEARNDLGADMPDSIKSYNGGVWQNYKMCVVSSFEEGDPQPWSHYSGSLSESLRATHEAIQKQIIEGGKQVPEFSDFDAKSLGPWKAPYNKPTTWCSNPNVEAHPANGRTSCIGCHQGSFTLNDARPGEEMQFWQIMAGDVPQFGRSQYRKNFPPDFAWSFGMEFQGEIASTREDVGFDW